MVESEASQLINRTKIMTTRYITIYQYRVIIVTKNPLLRIVSESSSSVPPLPFSLCFRLWLWTISNIACFRRHWWLFLLGFQCWLF
jgi:hypothetical protein